MDTMLEGADDYRLLFEVTPLPLIVYDPIQCTVLNVNEAALETYGYTRAEFIGLHLDQILSADSWQHFKTTILPSLELANANPKTISRHYRKTGELFDVEVSRIPVRFASRSAHLSIIVDITERLHRERHLTDIERQHRELCEKANDAIYTHDLEGNLTSMNQAGLQFLGYEHDEFMGMHISRLLSAEDLQRAIAMIDRKRNGDLKNTVYEVRVIAKDGRRLPVELSTTMMFQEGKAVGVQGIARILVERKRVEEQLKQAQKMEAVGRLAGGIAHDFNNRLTAIQGFTDLLLRRAAKGEQQHYYLEQIKQASERAGELTRQLLTFSRKEVLHPKILNLNEVVMEWGNLVRVLLGENIAVHLILGSDIGLVRADPGQLEHVIMNLALNACDAMPEGGDFTIETTDLEISDLQARFNPGIPSGDYVRLVVKDNGSGMSEETQSHLFEPFYSTKAVGKGTGLGLFTAYGIIKQSGGFVEVKSTTGEGTTFLIYLPVVKSEKLNVVADAAIPEVVAGRETILVVEDEPIVRMLVGTVLRDAGYNVLEAESGPNALALIAGHDHPIDLLLTDLRMPTMNGCDLAEKVKALCPDTSVMFMSAYTDDSAVMIADNCGEVTFLQKPFAPDVLARKVRELLDARDVSVAATA